MHALLKTRYLLIASILILGSLYSGKTLATTNLEHAKFHMEFRVDVDKIDVLEREVIALLRSAGYDYSRRHARLPAPQSRVPLHLFFSNPAGTAVNFRNLVEIDRFSFSMFPDPKDETWLSAANAMHHLIESLPFCRITDVKRR